MRRTLQIGVWAVGMLVGTRAGMAEPAQAAKAEQGHGPPACQAAYKKAQKAEQEGELVTAKRFLRICAKAKCGVFLEHQCTFNYARIESDMPTVVPVATDDSGKPVVDMMLKVDGYILAERLDGHAVPINPGMHEFTFETSKGVVARRRIMILQGQRNRRLAVSVGKMGKVVEAEPVKPPEQEPAAEPDAEEKQADEEKPPARGKARAKAKAKVEVAPEPEAEPEPAPDVVFNSAPPPAPRKNRWFSAGSYALLGTGVLGMAGYGVLTYWGRKDNDKLGDCSPNCPQASVDHIDKLYLGANISLGVGAAALLGGAFLVWRQHSSYSIEVEPTQSGALATFSGAF
jgi:hypothetical protein